MKHAFVDATLTEGERVAPFARLGAPDDDRLETPTRYGIVFDARAGLLIELKRRQDWVLLGLDDGGTP